MPDEVRRGLLDTNILILRHAIEPAELPDEMAISAITLAELSAGVHLVTAAISCRKLCYSHPTWPHHAKPASVRVLSDVPNVL